ncbi:MAG: hypothetical protein AAFN93_24820, partial [Bacteroidota bacterium]
ESWLCHAGVTAFVEQLTPSALLLLPVCNGWLLRRRSNQHDKAMTLFQESIGLCEQIGATCDQAEAFFQLGLTLSIKAQQNSSEACSNDYFNRAISLFSSINAPKQVGRVIYAKSII